VIDDDSFKTQLLSCLPPAYDILVKVVNEKEDDSEITVKEVVRGVQRGGVSPSISANSSAVSLYTNHSNRDNYRGNYPESYRGCRFRSTPHPTFQGTCNVCRKPGHKAIQCTKKRPWNALIVEGRVMVLLNVPVLNRLPLKSKLPVVLKLRYAGSKTNALGRMLLLLLSPILQPGKPTTFGGHRQRMREHPPLIP
jgi:hypothetical protein